MAYKPKEEANGRVSCPTPEEVIADYLEHSKRSPPKGAPSDPWQFAKWWMAHQIPPDDFAEAPTPPVVKGGSWETPYHDRLMYTLKKFLRLKRIHQLYIIENVEKGVPWKGDDISFYTRVVEENIKMQANREQYIDDGFGKMTRALRGMQA